jgi:hypothetical protein
MIVEALKIGSLITLIYHANSYYESNVRAKLDSPENNLLIKGLDPTEIKLELKKTKQDKKELEQLIKSLESERKNLILTHNKDQAQEKLLEKQEKLTELKELEQNYQDMEITISNSYLKKLPNKLTSNNVFHTSLFLIPLLSLI